MGAPEYGRRRKDGIWPVECACHICGADRMRPCWDLRSPAGTTPRALPHRERGDRGRGAPATPVVQRRYIEAKLATGERGKARLTPIGETVLGLICEGLTDAAIGRRMQMSTDGAKGHIRDVLWRLGAQSKAHAVHLAYQRGVLRVDGQQFPKCRWCETVIVDRAPGAAYCSTRCVRLAHDERRRTLRSA